MMRGPVWGGPQAAGKRHSQPFTAKRAPPTHPVPNFARCDVGGRARSWCPQRPCELAGWVLADAASSPAAALLQLLVVHVLNICILLWICGAMLQQSTCINAACQQTLVLAAMTELPIVMGRMRHGSLGASTLKRNINGGLLAQPAMGLLQQGSRQRRHSELAYVFFAWRMSFSRSSFCCATRQRRLRTDRTRVAGSRAVLLLLCCWPSGARGLLLWLLLLLELVVVVLAVLLLLLRVVVVQE